MYIDNMTTHMSMHISIARRAADTSNVGTKLVVGGGCRGMLAQASGSATGGVQVNAEVPRPEEPDRVRGRQGRAENDGIGDEAGTSRSKGPRTGRPSQGVYSSESE